MEQAELTCAAACGSRHSHTGYLRAVIPHCFPNWTEVPWVGEAIKPIAVPLAPHHGPITYYVIPKRVNRPRRSRLHSHNQSPSTLAAAAAAAHALACPRLLPTHAQDAYEYKRSPNARRPPIYYLPPFFRNARSHMYLPSYTSACRKLDCFLNQINDVLRGLRRRQGIHPFVLIMNTS